ncbi:MAG: carbohydrate-binding domain-containing protein [Lachnospiraceae bacterium]|nr:carbohydrate-binding domain-containing protein [Lachnospiraceae bacterium]
MNTENTQTGYESRFSITKADADTEGSEVQTIDLNTVTDKYTIDSAGTYLLSGSFNGTLCVDAEEQIVHLILDGVSIHSATGPAISVLSAGKVILTLKGGASNTLRDSAQYHTSGEENACIYSICDLTVNGSGTLNLYGYYKDALHSKDIVKILGGEINIQAKRDGIRGNDGILICNDKLNIESEGTGLHVTKNRKATKGAIEISAGEHSIISGKYAISSTGDFFAENCTIYGKGILSCLDVGGNSYIQEGCLTNE